MYYKVMGYVTEGDEWKELRTKGIGGSDAGAIAGVDKWKTRLSLYLDKTGQSEDREDNEAMRQGRDFEEYVAKRFEEATGKKVRRRNAILQHADSNYYMMIGNVDRLVIGENAGLECKTTSIYRHSDWVDGKVPMVHQVQCHHYMAVTGAERWYIACLVLNKELIINVVERDDEFIKYLQEEERKFWQEFVEPRVMPVTEDGHEVTDSIIDGLYPQAEAEKEIYLPEGGDKIKRYREIKTMMAYLEKEEREIQQFFKNRMGDAERASVEGADNPIFWSNVKTNRFDTTRFKESEPELYKQYLKETESRRFQIKFNKEDE